MFRVTKGVHLSPLGFAACQSKKCTNLPVSAFYLVGAVLALASGKAERRQLHPLMLLFTQAS